MEGQFTGYGDINLYYQCWLPDTEPKAILLIAHGLAEHSGRYVSFASRFASRGYATYGYDHRGHGKSEGLRGYVRRFSEYINDLRAFFNLVRSKHRDTKIFLFGHSMGGTVSIAYAVSHQRDLAGLILSGATLKLDPKMSPVLAALAPLISVLTPKLGTIVIDASAISRDKTVVDAYVNDPLVYRGKISARLGAELIKMMKELPSQMSKINLPILILQGTADRLSNPEGIRMSYENIGSKDKTLKLYEGFYHEVFNEPEKEQVLSEIESWLAART